MLTRGRLQPAVHDEEPAGDAEGEETSSDGRPVSLAELAAHRPSHRRLLRKLVTDRASRPAAPLLDAIIMPINRRLDEPRSGVVLAARLARELGKHGSRPVVVLLCSGAARSAHLPRDLFTGTRVLVLDLTTDYRPPWPRLRTDEHILSHYQRRNDVGIKRNLGLVLARGQNWKNVLMLDDDVFRFTNGPQGSSEHFGLANLADALVALRDYGSHCAGWVLEDFADNSVVCHARRLLGREQDKFIGGGALLVRCDRDVPFFPATYNEDWLFLLPFMREDGDRRRAVIEGGLVGQDRYPVFVERRARAEELGDLLGEGLFNLLKVPARRFTELCASYDYWQEVLRGRREMIEGMLEELRRRAVGLPEPEPAVAALEAALGVHRELQANWSSSLAVYCRQWLEDLETWSAWLPEAAAQTPARLGFVEVG